MESHGDVAHLSRSWAQPPSQSILVVDSQVQKQGGTWGLEESS